jgi:hypothetical protein
MISPFGSPSSFSRSVLLFVEGGTLQRSLRRIHFLFGGGVALLLLLCCFLPLSQKWQNRRLILSHSLTSFIPPYNNNQREETLKPFRLKNVTVQVWDWEGASLEDHWVSFGGEKLQLPNYLGAEVEKRCEVGCHFVGGRKGVERADAVILEPPLPHYKDWAHEGIRLPLKLPHQKWFVLSYETPIYFPTEGREEFKRVVDYNMSYLQTSALPITLTCSWGGGGLEDFLKPPPSKPKELAPVVFMASNCGAGGALERRAYVQELMKWVNVDSYGSCLNNKELPTDMQKPIYDDHGTAMRNKIKVFRCVRQTWVKRRRRRES